MPPSATPFPSAVIPTSRSCQSPAPGDADAAGALRPGLSLPRLLKACAGAAALSQGKQLHALSYKLRFSSDIYVQTSLLSMYASCGHLEDALRTFDRMRHRTIVTWTAAFDACIRSNRPGAAVSLFLRMLESGIRPDRFAIVSLLSACSHLGALDLGRAAHGYVEKTMDAEFEAVVGTALVDMYSKCGVVEDAFKVFDKMSSTARTVECWNAMLHCFSIHGHGNRALQLFLSMESKFSGIQPNELTFLALLCGCSHSGLVDEGRHCFNIMRMKYGVEPGVKHYSCMVDMLGRAGLLDEALQMALTMPIKPNYIIWGSLLSACRIHKNMPLAEQVMKVAEGEEFPVGDTSHYVVMSNMYREAELVEKMASSRTKVGKKPQGKSWIEVGSTTYEFGVWGYGGQSHDGRIKRMLEEVE